MAKYKYTCNPAYFVSKSFVTQIEKDQKRKWNLMVQ